MNIFEIINSSAQDIPGDAVPYKSTNQSGRMHLSPYINDFGAPDVFKETFSLVEKVERLIDAGEYQIVSIPTGRVLATQYWLDDMGGGGEELFDELEDYPVAVKLSDGYYHILDGHHRTDAAIARRKPRIKVYLFTL